MPEDRGLYFETALLPDGWRDQVRIGLRNGLIASVAVGVPPEADDERHAVALPGLPNLHSHAFQRGMAGLAEARGPSADSFWTWRELMYRFVDRIAPDDLAALAAMAYVEMLECGFTRVGEFHYLHHDRDGRAFAAPAEMSAAIAAAAQESGIALTHLPVFYAHAGFAGETPGTAQRRFLHDIDGFARLLEGARSALAGLPDAVLGIAPHSLRAVSPEELATLGTLDADGPVHIHIAEQTAEVDACLAARGTRPVDWLLDHVEVDERWCLVHATHVTASEGARIVGLGAVVGLCPITEANLGDGVFPAADFAGSGGRYGIGSDSNVLIDATEELRLLEYGQRLTARGRNMLAGTAGASTGEALYRAALTGGSQALGVKGGIIVGYPADLASLDTSHASLRVRRDGALLDGLIFAAGRQGVDCVWRRGEKLVTAGRHHARERVASRYGVVLDRLLA